MMDCKKWFCCSVLLSTLCGCNDSETVAPLSANSPPSSSAGTTDMISPSDDLSEGTTDATARSSEKADSETPGFYTVAEYDEAADLEKQLDASLTRARAEQKRLIIQAGGDWCNWCERIAAFMKTEEKVRELLDKHFLVMKVHFPSEKADKLIEDFPQPEAYPHFYVLDPGGNLLHSQDTELLEEGDGYNAEKFVEFLEKYKS